MATNEVADKREVIVSDGMLTVEEARQFLRVSRSSLYGLMDSGELSYIKFGRNRRIPRKALLEFAARGLVAC